MSSAEKGLFAKFNCNAPAGTSLIHQFELESGTSLPDSYVRFLRRANGGDGFLGNAYVILWRVEELMEMNKSYQVAEYAPGFILFGSDGGGEAFAFDARSEAKPIVSVPFIGMRLDEARSIAQDFEAFLEALSSS